MKARKRRSPEQIPALTEAACGNMKTKLGERREEPDGSTPGLYIVVNGKRRSWALRYRSPTTKRHAKFTFGRYDKNGKEPVPLAPEGLSLKAARAVAHTLKTEISRGIDPAAAHRARAKRIVVEQTKQQGSTFSAVARRFAEEYQKDEKRLRTWRKNARVLGLVYMPNGELEEVKPGSLVDLWGELPVSEITAEDVFHAIDQARSGVQGRPVRVKGVSKSREIEMAKVLGSFFKFAKRRRLVSGEALAGIDVERSTRKRDRVLTDDELRCVWEQAETLDPRHRDIIRLLILTGQRKGEVASMAWADVSGSTWTIPADVTKNKLVHEVHLADMAREIVEAQPTKDRVYVFSGRPSYAKDGTRIEHPISGWGKVKERLDEQIAEEGEGAFGDKPWVFHSIRHTVFTNLRKMRISVDVAGAVVNHMTLVKPGIAGTYDHETYEEPKRQALEAWASRVKEVVSRKKKGNVVNLRRSQA